MIGNYKVITLCGSTRFKDEFMQAQKILTLAGNIVISVGLFGHSGDNEVWEGMDEDTLTQTKVMLDDMHKRKIDMADCIFVVNVGDYVGSSTKSEIDYAIAQGKEVSYLVPSAYELKGKEIQTKDERVHIVTDVTFFKEDTFNQGKYAVTTDSGLYLYPREFILVNLDFKKECEFFRRNRWNNQE